MVLAVSLSAVSRTGNVLRSFPNEGGWHKRIIWVLAARIQRRDHPFKQVKELIAHLGTSTMSLSGFIQQGQARVTNTAD